jgi:predicted DNA-binding transcriptional regulator YafY
MQRAIFERLSRIDHLIRIKGTGTPAQLAERLNLSERSIYDYINFMKDLGCPIKFDSYRESYYYEEDGGFLIAFYSKSKLVKMTNNTDAAYTPVNDRKTG